jgi:hypothetical protein
LALAAALAPGVIVATDTTFSSNRFVWTHQVFDRIELKEAAMYQLHSTQLKRCHPFGSRVRRAPFLTLEGFHDDL